MLNVKEENISLWRYQKHIRSVEFLIHKYINFNLFEAQVIFSLQFEDFHSQSF